jgi:hypothetical protein
MHVQPQSAAPIPEWKLILKWKPTRDPRKTNRAAMTLEARFREAAA